MGYSQIIGVDFDGTIAKHEYPRIGDPVPGAFKWLRVFQQAQAALILWTMRSDSKESGPVLTEAVEFCAAAGIKFVGHNHNPWQASWTSSPKIHADIYVDDAALGCPLIYPKASLFVPSPRPYVDWEAVGPQVMQIILG